MEGYVLNVQLSGFSLQVDMEAEATLRGSKTAMSGVWVVLSPATPQMKWTGESLGA